VQPTKIALRPSNSFAREPPREPLTPGLRTLERTSAIGFYGTEHARDGTRRREKVAPIDFPRDFSPIRWPEAVRTTQGGEQ
jgi:hypothetical protein